MPERRGRGQGRKEATRERRRGPGQEGAREARKVSGREGKERKGPRTK